LIFIALFYKRRFGINSRRFLHVFVVDFICELKVISKNKRRFQKTRDDSRQHWYNAPNETMSNSTSAVATSSSSSSISASSDSSDSSDSSEGENILVLTGEEILKHGLLLLGWTEKQLNRKGDHLEKHTAWFQCDFGASHHVVAQIFSDLQTTDIAAAQIHSATTNDLDHLLFAFHFLKVYPTEGQRQNKWHQCDKTLRENGWDMLLRIQALKATKIKWPTDAEIADNIWIGSVDGTHVKTVEPTHPMLPKDTKAFSYKNKAAGLSYEIVVSLWESRIIWINGPYPASYHDSTIFDVPGGLRNKLQGTGKRLIGDKGYSAHDDIVSIMNAHDSPEVSKVKTRARLRHEGVNSKIKTLRVTDSARFRHMGVHKDGQDKFKICFEAAVVVTQYKMEITEPLFDI
jgi:DDE superfamily endonuclease